MRDVLDDDERKLRPTSLILIATATILSGMIVYNGLTAGSNTRQLALTSPQATTRMEVTVPDSSANTVVFKYDADVENVQRELLATGHYKGLVDGVMGERTKQAIQQYQQDNALAVTGDVSNSLVNHIRYTRKIKAAAEFTGSVEPSQIDVAPPALKPVQPINVQKAQAPVKQNKHQAILRVQMSLANLGYDLGEPSGVMDDATRAAILQYEMENGLAMEGVIDDPLLASLTKTLPKKTAINN
jgi:peptidoglycan hydrolase-like protein with peptidoglycan-binding domain